MSDRIEGEFQEYHIYKPGKRVVISDTFGFAEALVEMSQKLIEVMAFVSIEDDDPPEGDSDG